MKTAGVSGEPGESVWESVCVAGTNGASICGLQRQQPPTFSSSVWSGGRGQVALRATQPAPGHVAPGHVAPGQVEWRPAGLLAGEGIEASVLEVWRGSEPGGRQ